jgi:hypothetical protein
MDSTYDTWWTAYGADIAICWRTAAGGGSEDLTGTEPCGLVVYGQIDSTRLRTIKLARVSPEPQRHPRWSRHEPPSQAELAGAWAESGIRATGRGRLVPTGDRLLQARRPGESPDSFYRRVASFYTWAAATTGTPLKEISKDTGANKSTAARWVREARHRGYLPATTRGKGRA